MTVAGQFPRLVQGEQALAEFRRRLTGPLALDMLREGGGRVLARLPVGAGKTRWLREIAAHALRESAADLVVVLAPRWDLLREIHSGLPPGLSPLLLRPRPRKRCGALDEPWREYERAACGALGREQLCSGCPRRDGCSWPGQYGKGLKGVRLVLATQTHLEVNPHFVRHLRLQAQARKPLVLIDEANLFLRPMAREVAPVELDIFIEALELYLAGAGAQAGGAEEWLRRCQDLRHAATADLRGGGWELPRPEAAWVKAVQRAGRERHGEAFSFPAYKLLHLARSDVASRERLPGGAVRFATVPDLGPRFMVFSASLAGDLARYRLDPESRRPGLHSPLDGVEVTHPGTRWYNVEGIAAAACYFPGNAPRIVNLFAQLVARNIRKGKSTLLVARKKFAGLCATLMTQALAGLGHPGARVVTKDWGRHDLGDPLTVPLVSYGMVGVNLFEGFDCAYCLTSYLVPAEAVAVALHDLEPSDAHYRTRIETGRNPCRRVAVVELPPGQQPSLPAIASGLLTMQEADVVVQAVGRVRPFTRPREVITQHPGDLPGVRFTATFEGLAALRGNLGLLPFTLAAREEKTDRARRLRAAGRTVREIAAELDVSPSSVKRYLRVGGQGQ